MSLDFALVIKCNDSCMFLDERSRHAFYSVYMLNADGIVNNFPVY